MTHVLLAQLRAPDKVWYPRWSSSGPGLRGGQFRSLRFWQYGKLLRARYFPV